MKKKIFIALTIVIGIVGVYLMLRTKNASAVITDEECKYQTMVKKAPTDSSSPLDYSSYDNISFLMYNIRNEKSFKTITRGTSKAAFANIDIYGERIVKDNHAMVSSMSQGLVSSACQRYFFDDKVLLREASNIDGFNTSWNQDTPEAITTNSYLKRYGWLPYQATGYVICKETMLEEPTLTKNDDGTYSVNIKLNPGNEFAPFYYKREILTNSGSSILPIFSKIEITFEFNENWQILEAIKLEDYKIRAMGIEAISKTELKEEYYYDNIEYDNEALDYFNSYKDLEPKGEDSEDIKLDPLTIILSSFQNPDGSNKNLDLDILLDDTVLKANLSLNINDSANILARLKLGSLYLEYSDSIYLAYGSNIKVKLTESELTELINSILPFISSDIKEDSNEQFSLNSLIKDINNSSVLISDDNMHITIRTTINLGSTSFPFVTNITHKDGLYKLESIRSSFDLADSKVSLKVSEGNSDIIELDKSLFNDLSNTSYLLEDLISLLTNKKLKGSFSFNLANYNFTGSLSLDFNNNLTSYIDLNILGNDFNIDLDLYYQNKLLYLVYNDSYYSFDLRNYITNSNNTSYTLEDIIKLLQDTNIDEIVKSLNIISSNINLELNLSPIFEALDNILVNINNSNNGLNLKVNLFDLLINLSFDDEFIITLPDKDFIPLDNYLGLINKLGKLINKESINLTLSDVEVSLKDKLDNLYLINLSSSIDFILLDNNSYSVEGNINLTYKESSLSVLFYLANNHLVLNLFNQTIDLDLSSDNLTNLTNKLNSILEKLNLASLEFNLPSDLVNTIVSSLMLESSSIKLDLSKIFNQLSSLTIDFTKSLEASDILGDISFITDKALVKGSFNVQKSNKKELTLDKVLAPNITPIDLLNMLDIFVSTYLHDSFLFNVQTNVVRSNYLAATITGTIKVDITDRINQIFDLEVDLFIQEYKLDNSYYQAHNLNIKYFGSTNEAFYIKYGNAPLNNVPTSFIKATSNRSGIINLFTSLESFINSPLVTSFLDSFINNSLSNIKIDFNKLLGKVIFSDDSYNIPININNNLTNISLTSTNNMINTLDIDKLYLSYKDLNSYNSLDSFSFKMYHPNLDTDLSYKDSAKVELPVDTESYIYDLSKLDKMVDSLNHTLNEDCFDIKGAVEVSILGLIKPKINLEMKASRNSDLKLQLHLDIPYVNTIIYGKILEKTVDIYYENEFVYIYRCDKDGLSYKLKLHYKSFFDDIVYYLLVYAFGLPTKMYDMIVNSEAPKPDFIDASKCITKLEITDEFYNLGFSLSALTGNANLGNLEGTLNTILVNKQQADGTIKQERMLKSLTNFSVKFVSDIIILSSNELNLTNFTENIVLDVDMSSYDNFIVEHRDTLPDVYYEFSNNTWNEVGSVSHTIKYNMGIMPSFVETYATGEEINLPSYEDIIKIGQNQDTKYYRFNGFYLDSDFINPFNSNIMPSYKLELFAKWTDETINVTISKTNYNEEIIYPTYKGSSIIELNKLMKPVVIDNLLYTFSYFLLDGTKYDNETINDNLTLTPVFINTSFKASINNTIVELDFTNPNPIVSDGLYMVNYDEMYFIIPYYNLTAEKLYNNFLNSFDENNTICLLPYSELEHYYKVTIKNINERFNNKIYDSIFVKENSNLDLIYLPSSKEANYVINAWKVNNEYYLSSYSYNINVTSNLELEPYISINPVYLEYQGNTITSLNKNYLNILSSLSILALPIYNIDNIRIIVVGNKNANGNIAGAFENTNFFNTLIIPDGYKEIKEEAFKNARSLKDVYLADSITTISQDSFMFDYSTDFNTVKANAISLSIYKSISSKFTNTDLIACNWNNSTRLYGVKYYIIGAIDLTNTFKSFDGNILKVNNNLLK